MNLRLLALISLASTLALLPCPPLCGEDGYPEIEKFAEAITDTVWDLRGTSSLKHLRYDGEDVCSLNSSGEPGSPYDSAFVDVGVIRLDFRGPNAGWYFFSDDLKWLTPIRATGEIVFQIGDESAAKAVQSFPSDIAEVVWESQPDERELAPMKLRWNGRELEVGVNADGEWQVERHTPVVANRRVFEVVLADESVIWFVFGADGKEAWFLRVEGVYGGHARTVPRNTTTSAPLLGLSPQQNDLLSHAEDLLSAGETILSQSLRRQLLRSLAAKPDQADAVNSRLGGE